MADYTAHDLILAYMDVKELETHPSMHADLHRSRRARFKALSDCFGIQLVEGEYDRFPDDALRVLNDNPPDGLMADFLEDTSKYQCWKMFERTIRSCLAMETPFSGVLAQSGHLLHLYYGRFDDMAKAYRAEHLKLLDDLFRLMYGDISRIVTSDDLKAAGYDDAHQPNELDYW